MLPLPKMKSLVVLKEQLSMILSMMNWMKGGDVLFYIFPNDQAANYQNYFSFGPSVTNGVLDNVSGFVDDDPKPTVSVANLNPSVAEDGTSISIPVTLSNPTESQVLMTWSTSDGTATAGSDYERKHPQTLIFNPSTQTEFNTEETITINITDDADNPIYEDDETFTVTFTLTQPNGATIPGDTNTIEVTVTITDNDNDAKPTGLKFTNATSSVTETLSGNTVSIPISIDTAAGTDITVNYETATGSGDGAATVDSDFEATTTGTATIVAGQTTGTINIPILDDFFDEPDETFTVTITGADHADLSTTAADLTNTVNITDNDVPELSIAASGHAEEGGKANFIITSDIIPQAPLTINYIPRSSGFLHSSISGATLTTQPPLAFRPVDANDPTNTRATTTLSIGLDDDTLPNPNGDIIVTLQAETPIANTTYKVHATNDNATVQVKDDESKIIPVLNIEGPLASIVESGTAMATFKLTSYTDNAKSSSLNPGRPITIYYTPERVSGGFFLSNTIAGVVQTKTLNFTENGVWHANFDVPIENDNIKSATGEIRVTLNEDQAILKTYNVSTRGDHYAEATIWDDDAPELSISVSSANATIAEAADAKAKFTITATSLPTNALTIHYTPVSDFIENSGTRTMTTIPVADFTKRSVSIDDGNAFVDVYDATLEIDIDDDTLDEPNGNVKVTLHNEVNNCSWFISGRTSS